MPIKIAASEILPTIKKHKLDEAYNLSEDDLKAIRKGMVNEELSKNVNKMLLVERDLFPASVKRKIEKQVGGWKFTIDPKAYANNPENQVAVLETAIRREMITPNDAAAFAEDIYYNTGSINSKTITKLEQIIVNGPHTYKYNHGRA